MKSRLLKRGAALFSVIAALFVFAFLAFSCATSSLSIKHAASWTKDGLESPRKLKAGFISADKPGGGYSVEREIAELLPLVFLEKGYLFVEEASEADYVIDVRATEREFYIGWAAKKSVSLEILVWPVEIERFQSGTARHTVETPVAAGRTVAQGELGFSSSKNTEAVLRRSVNELVKSLAKLESREEGEIAISAHAPKE